MATPGPELAPELVLVIERLIVDGGLIDRADWPLNCAHHDTHNTTRGDHWDHATGLFGSRGHVQGQITNDVIPEPMSLTS